MKVSRVLSIPIDEFHPRPEVVKAGDPRWQLAQRIVASKSFAKSSFLINFLLYVCDRELRGKADEITEYQIGIQAFGRPTNYNPGEDNIVRNYARLLRKRLEEYFETEGKDETLRLCIPRGRYVPVFYPSSEPLTTPVSSLLSAEIDQKTNTKDLKDLLVLPPLDPPPVQRSRTRTLDRSLISFALIAALAAATYFGNKFFNRTPSTPSHQLWSQVFSKDRETLIVPADSGLGILQNLTGHSVHLGDYVSGAYVAKTTAVTGIDARNVKDLRTQRYTSVVDLNITYSLSRLPELVPDRFAIRYARDLSVEELKHSNAILLGSLHTNPWVDLFQKDLNFLLEYYPEVDDSVVVNRHPLSGEAGVYKNAWAGDSPRTYTVLAFVPSLDSKGSVILLQGLNMAGTQAAADFLLNEQAMFPILQKARLSDGTIQPFELLLEASSIGANAPEARVIAERYGLPKPTDQPQ